MGSQGKTSPGKPHYNISMSRRTRKPLNLKIEPQESFEEKEEWMMMSREKKIQQQKSLKQLIEGRCSLAQHFKEEEKQQQQSVVVRGPDQNGFDQGVKLKRMVRNYARVLSHLIKVKQESSFRSWRKDATSLKHIKHK
ncbi:hypothetical protein Pfo_005621 [Paulownia fortunei]|nr:hypothetical protein Pfo_005621 [Paulownia fortunei]